MYICGRVFTRNIQLPRFWLILLKASIVECAGHLGRETRWASDPKSTNPLVKKINWDDVNRCGLIPFHKMMVWRNPSDACEKMSAWFLLDVFTGDLGSLSGANFLNYGATTDASAGCNIAKGLARHCFCCHCFERLVSHELKIFTDCRYYDRIQHRTNLIWYHCGHVYILYKIY